MIKRFKQTPRDYAFTLVEVMVAMAVVALGTTSTLSLLTATRLNNAIEQERARARQIVYEQMEGVRGDLFSLVTSGKDITVWDNGTPDDPDDDTRGVLAVMATDAGGNLVIVAPVPARWVQIEVTLTWNPRGRLGRKTLRETVMTYIVP